MAVDLKTKEHIRGIRKAGRIVAACHKALSKRIAPGVTTQEIDRFVERFMLDRGATPAQKGYKGYPFATCASVNEVVCHGFPDSEPLEAVILLRLIWWLNWTDGRLIQHGPMRLARRI